MYLSKVTFSLSDRTGLSIASDRYAAHSFVASAFPDGRAARPLFRLALANGRAELLVQSCVEPDWTRARSYHTPASRWKAEVKSFSMPRLREGQGLRFLLVANVVKTIRPGGRPGQGQVPKAVRVPLIRDHEVLEWFRRQGERGGFLPRSVRVIPQRDRVVMRAANAGKPIVLSGAQFEGVIEVTDADLLWSAVRNGLGHGKAFGFGLLSIAPHVRRG